MIGADRGGSPVTVPIAAILNRKGHDVHTIASDASLVDAIAELSERRVGALVVSSDGSRVEGIVSERDVVRRLAEHGADALDLAVDEVMTREVTTCSKHETADDLMATMTEGRHRHVPVVEDGALIGIVSIGDVVKSRMDELEMQTETLQEYVTGGGY
jgi:CBS domain-containing protein